MKKSKKKGVLILLCLGLLAVTSSCHSNDPDYGNVTPPEIVNVHNISGSVAAISGKGISDATVTMSGPSTGTVTTDENGYFVFTDVKPGDYMLEASAKGKIAKSINVAVATKNTQNVVWNVMLASEASVTTVSVTPETQTEEEVTSESLEDNEKAQVDVELTVPENSVNKAATILMTPIYSVEEADVSRSTRAEESTLLLGTSISCDDSSVKIEKPFDLSFNVDNETASAVTAKKYVDGEWVDVPCDIVDGKVIVAVDEFTSYGVFLGINFSISSRNTDVTFSQSLWDNLYGSSSMKVGEVTYDYTVGTEIESRGTTVFTALLIEALARQFGANTFVAKGTYPINVTLPIGTALQISGTQQISTVSASAKGRSVSGTQYGTVTVVSKTWNRNHTGSNGGNQQ